MIRTAFVLGAGLGTRLRPLTLARPKPLIPVANRPLITYAFDHLMEAGVERFVVNTHWRPAAYSSAFPDRSYRGAPLLFRDEQPEILETGGGLKNAQDLLGNEPFIVYNGDIFADLPLEPALNAHFQNGDEVTLVLRSHGGPLQVARDAISGRVTDIGGRVDPSAQPRFLFTGIYIVQPRFLDRIPPATKVGVVPIFCEMVRAGAPLGSIVLDEGRWRDLGTREEYLTIHRELADSGDAAPWIDQHAKVSASARIRGCSAIGRGAVIGEKAWLRDCLVWDGAQVAPGAFLERCIVTEGACAAGVHDAVDFAPDL